MQHCIAAHWARATQVLECAIAHSKSGCATSSRCGANGVVSVTLNSDAAAQLTRLRVSSAVVTGPLLLAIAYFLGAQAAFFIGTLSDQIFALFWPPNVILFCALLIVPQRKWWLYFAAAFVAHTIAELGVGMPVPQLLVA